MDYTWILKRAFEITKKYRILWFFGLFAGTASLGGNFNAQIPQGEKWGKAHDLFREMEHGGEIAHVLTTSVILAIVAAVLLVTIVLLILRYVSLTALPRAIDRIESGDEEMSFSSVWKLGWSRRAWTVLGIGLVALFLILAVLLIVLLPFLFVFFNVDTISAGAFLKVLPFALLGLIVFVAVLIAVGLVTRFAQYHAAVVGTNVFDSIGWSIKAIKDNLGSVLLMWVIMIGVNILAGLVVLMGAVVFLIATVIFAGGIGWVLWKTVGEVWGIVAGVSLGLVTLLVPLLVLSGAVGAYKVTAWVLMYRELRQEESTYVPGAEAEPVA